MNIPWDQIIEAVIYLVEMCLAQGTSETEIDARLASPRLLDMLQLRARLRTEHGLTGRELREAMTAARVAAETCDSTVRQLLIAEAKAS